MIEGVRARFSKGAIVPLEPLDIEEGADLSLSIDIQTNHPQPDLAVSEISINQKLDELYIQDFLEKSRQ